MNHLIDIRIVKYEPWAFQNRVECPHKTFRTWDIALRRLKWFVPKKCTQKKFSKKNWPIFWKVFCTWNWLFQRWIHATWALCSPYFQWYPTLPSFPYLHIFTTLWIFKTQEKSRFIKNSLNYLSDHLSNVLKWKYESSAF